MGCIQGHFQIREQDPLKQGLKPTKKGMDTMTWLTIREQDPLKQGLKLKDHGIRKAGFMDS